MTINITPETPRKKIQVGGIILVAPTPFAEGHVLSANEAAAINQTYLENIGNNFRAAVIKAKKIAILGKADPTPDELKSVTDEKLKAFDDELEAGTKTLDVSALQADFDTLTAGYQMGVRRASSVTAYTPVEKAARAIAKDKLSSALKARGIKLNTVSADWYEREIGKLLDKENPVVKNDKNVTEEIWTTAERQVNLLNRAAAETLDDLDLDGVTKPAESDAETGDAGADGTAETPSAEGGKKRGK